jgi:hypothetical protein
VFTDVPRGELRSVDLVSQVPTLDGEPEMVLIHVEIEARGGEGIGERMHEYYVLLRMRHRLPVFPVALFVTRGRGTVGKARYEERTLGHRVVAFDYWRIALANLPAAEYLARESPLAYGLAALMRPRAMRPAELKARCLLRIARALLDEARRVLLANCVETYLPLEGEERQAFEELVQQPSFEEVSEMRSVYEIQGERRGKQRAALLQLREKFGELPERIEARIRAMETDAELEVLLRRILRANSLSELGLEGDAD